MSRKPVVAGNWKMNNGREATRSLLNALKAELGHVGSVEVVVAPVAVNLEMAESVLRGSSIGLAAQNMHHAERGAFTGEVPAAMLTEIGVKYVIIGHSERREMFGETDESVNLKLKAALSAGLVPIVCIGETLAEREAGRTVQVVSTQVKGAFAGVPSLNTVILAYEPIWAIGTGKTATPNQAQEIHATIRKLVAELYDGSAAEAIRILYGGSVSPSNAVELFGQPDIDGGLVGGASLKSELFAPIVRAAKA
jgi:triosephosphate isomerase